MRVLAVDWSGRAAGAAEFIWRAEVRNGRLCDLRNGLDRDDLLDLVIRERPDAVGFDFAFSFPRWFCEERGWRSAQEVWASMAAEGDELLGACEPPFWGRPKKLRPPLGDRLFRRTDRETGAGTAKSVFQIGGPGAVGTGSIRGMPQLLKLAEAGFGIWPFDGGGPPRVVEIYPRALTEPPVIKSSWQDRHAYLFEHFPDQGAELLERAAASEDAFDAAVSALVMGAHAEELASLTQPTDPDYVIEGRIWEPDAP